MVYKESNLGGKIGRPVFVWPTQSNRWTWLKKVKIKCLPGTKAAYSNLVYDLLADALAKAAGKSYKQLFAEKITLPAEMYDYDIAKRLNFDYKIYVFLKYKFNDIE
ncbi:D-alanyl-D-alanine-carboxypeptidase/endopeptidaseAmpH [Arsenophonus endosymbiont of Bemisia tabaci Q2]|nr:D-alanyl-D-alanine-carboxypeptidase/endopeptidaseAmpH [Arsenophonus endosymbiont of Bemisia tabaci Q2]